MLECPSIPVIVGDAPHLRVLGHLGRVFHFRRPRRQAQHDWAARLPDGLGDLANLGRPVGVVADAVHLDVIEAPAGIELEH